MRAISFTGSVATGHWVRDEATRAGKRVQLELGGQNPLIVMDDADLARAVGADLLRARAAVFLAAAVLAAGAVAAVGAIAFVGLTAAHLVRPLVGSHPARVVPLAALAGAGLLLGADLVASWATFTLPSQDVGGRTSLPTGAVTALIGGPLLLALVLRERR